MGNAAIAPGSNLEEYADPALYDLENNTFEPDGPFYLALAERFGGSVLEIGCGTGRVTVPLAQRGVAITGLDIASAMLERARSKAAGLPIRWAEADARTFTLDQRFDFIFESGATFQHMLTRADQEAMLARVRAHLAPEGRFAVGTIFPTVALMTTEGEHEWFSYTNAQGQTVRVSGTQDYDPLTQIRTETARRRWQDADGRDQRREAPLQLRHTFPQEMEALLHHNGFMVEERYGDFNFAPLHRESPFLIFLCRKA